MLLVQKNVVCKANQLTGFYMRVTLAFNALTKNILPIIDYAKTQLRL